MRKKSIEKVENFVENVNYFETCNNYGSKVLVQIV